MVGGCCLVLHHSLAQVVGGAQVEAAQEYLAAAVRLSTQEPNLRNQFTRRSVVLW